MKAVFSKNDLKFCSVPVPDINAHKNTDFEYTAEQIAAYTQSQTHPSIVYIPNGWNGHKYWLATTPYPAGTGVFENPCIYYGDEDKKGNPPTVFTPINGTASGEYTVVNNPVVKVNGTNAVNSDPDLILLNGTMWLISRANHERHCTYAQKSETGQAWTPRCETPLWVRPAPMEPEFISPSIIEKDGELLAYGLSGRGAYPYDEYNNMGFSWGIHILKGTTMEGVGDFDYWQKGVITGNFLVDPWHMDIFKDNSTGKIYMILCGNNVEPANSHRYCYLAESEDGVTFYLYGKPLMNAYRNYRPTAFLRESDRKLIVYFSTEYANVTADELPNGASDMSNDGRYIVMAEKNFDTVLNELKAGKITNLFG